MPRAALLAEGGTKKGGHHLPALRETVGTFFPTSHMASLMLQHKNRAKVKYTHSGHTLRYPFNINSNINNEKQIGTVWGGTSGREDE
jgi:hypothetical protein